MIRCKVDVNDDVARRARAKLKKQKDRVTPRTASVGVHDPQASAPALNYAGVEGNATLGEVAVWNEYGTDKVPERSFMRAWFDQNAAKMRKELSAAVAREFKGGKNIGAVESVAAKWGDDLRDWMRGNEGGLEEPSSATQRSRAVAGIPESPPLVATEQLINAVTVKVKRD